MMLESRILRTAIRNYPTCWNFGDPWEVGLGAHRNGIGYFGDQDWEFTETATGDVRGQDAWEGI